MNEAAKPLETLDGLITEGQRRAIFAAGRAKGLGIEELRAMTPAGSISALSRRQANVMLTRLNGHTAADSRRPTRPRGPRRPMGVIALVSEAQLAKIESLRIDLGWPADKLAAFLGERHYSHGGPMSQVLTSKDGIERIELLKSVLQKQLAADSKRATKTRHEA